MTLKHSLTTLCAVLATAGAGSAGGKSVPVRATPAGPQSEQVPSNQTITPLAAPRAIFSTLDAGQASAVALSPDGRTLLILTSGYNKFAGPDGKPDPARSSEHVFVYDVGGSRPALLTSVPVPNSFLGLAWGRTGGVYGPAFYVSGGVDDDVLEFQRRESPAGARYGLTRTFALGHKAGLGIAVKPEAAGLAVSPDGARLLVANLQNDSVSLIDLASGKVLAELDLRPGVIGSAPHGTGGGTFPRAVAWTGPDRAWVAAERDREVVQLSVSASGMSVVGRTPLKGQPTALAVTAGGLRLLVTEDNDDALSVIDAGTGAVLERTPTVGPANLVAHAGRLGGAGSNSLTVAADGRTAYVTNGGQNAVAVVRLGAAARGAPGAERSAVAGLIPTGWYPTAVSASRDGSRLYVVNGKSNPGPNPGGCRNTLSIAPGGETACKASGQYVWQLEKAGFLTLPTPSDPNLAGLTRRVAINDGYVGEASTAHDSRTMTFLHAHIHHVIYIVKENRTYDQVLGDLRPGDGDARLALFPEPITPNHHALARGFVTLDAFRDSGESSNTGWNWTTAARTNDWTEREAPINYAGRGLQYDQEGQNRNVAVAVGGLAERRRADPDSPDDPDVLAGPRDIGELDGPDADEGHGYLWDAARRAGLSLRNWGFYGNLDRYDPKKSSAPIPLERDPHHAGLQVFFPNKPALAQVTDLYFRGFDQAFPDYWRFQEWKREFDGFSARRDAPALMLVRLPHDHFGAFDRAIDGVNTVETEIADNDYAVGLLVQAVAASPFAADTLVFVVEDDAQDGPDHVDAHRSLALIAGPYVRQHAVVSTPYTTVNLVRTIEAVLGMAPMNLNDAHARAMDAVFDISQRPSWSYQAIVPGVLRTTQLPMPAGLATACARPRRSAAWWTEAMAGQDFSSEDKLDTVRFNRALWRGLKGATRYPTRRVKGAGGTPPTVGAPCA